MKQKYETSWNKIVKQIRTQHETGVINYMKQRYKTRVWNGLENNMKRDMKRDMKLLETRVGNYMKRGYETKWNQAQNYV